MSDTSTWPEGLRRTLLRARTEAGCAADVACGVAAARRWATAANDKVASAEREVAKFEAELATVESLLSQAREAHREREAEAAQCAAMLLRVQTSFGDAIRHASDDAERRLGSIVTRMGLGVDADGKAWRVVAFTASSIVAESADGTRAAFDLKPREDGGHVELTNGFVCPVVIYLLHTRGEIAIRLSHGPIQFPPAALVSK
jgi:hypothetical protein